MTKAKTGPQDVFIHLLSIILLYTIVINLGVLIFQYINIYFPDALDYIYGESARNVIRFPISVLIIIFPFFAWLSSYIQKDLQKNPEKRNLKTRKWLLYFTLFLTTLVILVDIVSIIYHFLSGEITIRFILKVITVLLIAVSVFTYYLWNLKKDIPPSSHPKMKWFVKSVITVVGTAVIAGFFTAGSPFLERLRRFDQERVNALSNIQFEIVEYWRAKLFLPKSIEDLKDEIRGFYPPTDPETGKSYEYKIIGDKTFELCAIFKTSNKEEKGNKIPKPIYRYGIEETFLHDEGYSCFSRTIDPDKYPPLEKAKR